jgi:tetratricopeptide (TPR) repeat protein
MRRAPIIAIVPAVMLLACAVWLVSQSFAQEVPKDGAKAPASTTEAPATETSPTTATPAAEKPIPEVMDAVELFKQRDIEGAVKKLRKALIKNPDLPPPYVIIAEFLAKANLSANVPGSLEQATVDSPDDPEAYFLLGEFSRRENRVIEARLLYEKADSLMPKLASAKRKKLLQSGIMNGLVMTAGARQDWVTAQKHAEAWLKLEPENTMALQQLAQCLLRQKLEDAALEQLVKARKIEPKLMSPEAILAQYYARSNDQENAKKWMKAALNKDLNDIRTRMLVAQWMWENGAFTDARKQADAALKLDEGLEPKLKSTDQSVSALVLRGVIALFQKEFEVAEGYFQAALIKSPSNFAASNNLALALIEQKNPDKQQRAFDYARDNAQKYTRTNQASEAAATYGWVLYKRGDLDNAEKMLRAAASSPTYSSDTLYYLARVLFAKGGNNKDIRQLLEKALEFKGPFQNRDDAKSLLEELKK